RRCGTIARENYDAIAAPVARPMPALEYIVAGIGPRSFFHSRYHARVMKTGTGNTDVTSMACASKVGEKANNPRANKPEALPNMSRAQRNTIRPPRVASRVMG